MGALWVWGWVLSLRNDIRAMEPGAGPSALGREPRRLPIQDVSVSEPKRVREYVGCVCGGEQASGRASPFHTWF